MVIEKAGWLCIKARKLLMVRSIGKTIYYVPGGKIDKKESIQDALVREIKEELNVNLTKTSLTEYKSFAGPADGKSNSMTVNIACYFGEYKGTLEPSSEIAELAWLDSANLAMVSAVSKKIMTELTMANLID